MAFSTSLESQTVYSLQAYATSSFGKHSLLAAIGVVSGIVNGRPNHQLCPRMLFPY